MQTGTSGTERLRDFLARPNARGSASPGGQGGEGSAGEPYPRTGDESRGRGPEPSDRGWYGGLYTYPDGGGEVVAIHRESAPRPPMMASARSTWRAPTEEDRARNRERAARRARSELRRVILAAGHDRMVTLTFPGEGVHDYDQAAKLVAEFVERHHGLAESGGGFTIVLELHPGGHGWHAHISMRGWTDVVSPVGVRARWTGFLQRRGFPCSQQKQVRVQVQYFGLGGASKLSNYMAKYLGKTFESAAVPPGRHRYRVGRDTPRPVREAVFVAELDQQDLDGVMELGRQLAGPAPVTLWCFVGEMGPGVRLTWGSASPRRRGSLPGHLLPAAGLRWEAGVSRLVA